MNNLTQIYIITELGNIMYTKCNSLAEANELLHNFKNLEAEADASNERLPRSIIELVRTHIDIQLERNRWKRFYYSDCEYCNGTGEIEPCCRGDILKIECACYGRIQICDRCEEGKIKIYKED